jgi:hypothetical protein
VFDQLFGRVTLAVAVDLLAQPAQECGKVPPGKLGVEVAEIGSSRGEELGCVQVAQGIGREVADQTFGPVSILQAALDRIGGDHAQILLVRGVPGFGDIGGQQVAGNQRSLELEPYQDVQVVGHLVGTNADTRPFDPIDTGQESVELEVVERVVEHRPGPWIEVLPEAPAPTDQVLPQPGLGLVHTQRGGLTHGRAVVLGLEALLVQSMAGLV